MSNSSFQKDFFTFFIYLFFTVPVVGQISLLPINHSGNKNNNNFQARVMALDTISLPFWEDFSQISDGKPGAALWSNSDNIYVNNGLGLAAPTSMVATFDGVDKNGDRYSINDANIGIGDSLSSQAINLKVLPFVDRSSVFFSFYWQKKGNGDIPEREDFLELLFLDSNGDWISQWKKTGQDDGPTTTFQQTILQVDGSDFFHEGFRFKFQAKGRLSGAFDTWNVDYIYLNSGRSQADTIYLDRAMVSQPTSLFNDYFAIPKDQFFADPGTYIGNSSAEFKNLDQELQPLQYTVNIKDAETDQILQVVNNQQLILPIPRAFERKTIEASALNASLLDPNADEIKLETEFILTSGDNFIIDNIDDSVSPSDTTYSTFDLRSNDTIRSTTYISDYLAYDDGMAEYGAGITGAGAQLAVAFDVATPDVLTDIDIYFPRMGASQASQSIVVKVFNSLVDFDDDLLYSSSDIIIYSDSLNRFTRYSLPNPILVQGTIYIGFRQTIDDAIPVGFDKNTDSGSKVYFNQDGTWNENTDVSGSLMIRPVFRALQPTALGDDEIGEEFKIFPNPASASFAINQHADHISILDLNGKQLFELANYQKLTQLRLPQLSTGIYLVQATQSGITRTKRLIIQN